MQKFGIKKETHDIIFEFLAFRRGHSLNSHSPGGEIARIDAIPGVDEPNELVLRKKQRLA